MINKEFLRPQSFNNPAQVKWLLSPQVRGIQPCKELAKGRGITGMTGSFISGKICGVELAKLY
jgi:sulfur relay (sulfurtransferase) complex TusBCD TusD component (DsrE family)